ncbi:death domain-containing protein cradd [Elysia marginata]|uniref:Death domain-containing protein cradd n=1 Tax=Elysia marginata TaxID=1093978 RepID=A0AAV4JCZ9_9GAST|nr:death domain-containing protein cradd [Elysia marginata]
MPVKKGKLKPDDEAKIRSNYLFITEQVDARDLTGGLYQENVFTVDDVEEIEALPSRAKRTEKMLSLLLGSGPGEAYNNFLKVLKVAYDHVAEALEATSTEVEQNSTWTWFDEMSDETKSMTISDGDSSRISSKIGTGWEKVILCLGLTNVNISQVQSKHPNDRTLVITNLLIRWRQSKGRAATLQSLVQVLREVDDLELDIEGLKTVILNMSSRHEPARPIETSL